VMGGSVVEPETTLLPLSMILPEMYLPSGIYEGSPAELVSAENTIKDEIISTRVAVSHD
jgi:hypothetical protein